MSGRILIPLSGITPGVIVIEQKGYGTEGRTSKRRKTEKLKKYDRIKKRRIFILNSKCLIVRWVQNDEFSYKKILFSHSKGPIILKKEKIWPKRGYEWTQAKCHKFFDLMNFRLYDFFG